jgi:hypothetical protein
MLGKLLGWESKTGKVWKKKDWYQEKAMSLRGNIGAGKVHRRHSLYV